VNPGFSQLANVEYSGMGGVTRFEDLVVWRKARELALEIHRACAAGRTARDYSLVDQLRRATISIASNISEGFERKRASSFAQFLEYARGSCAELRAQLYLAKDVGWLSQDEFQRLMALAEEVGRLLGALHSTQARRR
jgi:four helix bundle protein